MTAVAVAAIGAYGVYLLYTSIAFGWRGLGLTPRRPKVLPRRKHLAEWLSQAGLDGIRPGEFLTVMGVLFATGGVLTYALFGGVVPAFLAACFAATAPVVSHRTRREQIRAEAREAWPRLIEEMRIQTNSLGRSIPQALFDVGKRAPKELRPAFAAAERAWLISTDFDRTVAVLKDRLADPTADAACETLLVAHEVGGSDIDRRLAALAEDRVQDLDGRKDARAKQAGVRFARRFVLVVPAGMALAGLSIGTGRAAYQTPLGQVLVVAGVAVVVVCWMWAGRLLRLPAEERVFYG